jgi:signal transduction histidine kinase
MTTTTSSPGRWSILRSVLPRVHQQLLQRITEIGFLHSAEPSTPTISAGQFAAWFERTRRNEVEPLLKEHGRELRVGNYEGCADETRIRWDGEAMADIVRELVINALKYSREGAPVGVEYQFETAGPHPFCAVRVRNQPRPESGAERGWPAHRRHSRRVLSAGLRALLHH